MSGASVGWRLPDRVGSYEWVGDADFNSSRGALRSLARREGPLDRRRYRRVSCLGAAVIWDGGDFLGRPKPFKGHDPRHLDRHDCRAGDRAYVTRSCNPGSWVWSGIGHIELIVAASPILRSDDAPCGALPIRSRLSQKVSPMRDNGQALPNDRPWRARGRGEGRRTC